MQCVQQGSLHAVAGRARLLGVPAVEEGAPRSRRGDLVGAEALEREILAARETLGRDRPDTSPAPRCPS